MNLIIQAELVNPPTTMGSFRDLTFFASLWPPKYDVLIHCDKEFVDIYYKFIKRHVGSLDFIKDFIFDKEYGVYITQDMTDRITPETMPRLLKAIGFRFS